jgi:hypothetical protein
MEASYIAAVSGLLGAAIGGMTSFCTAWLTQSNQERNVRRDNERSKREALFGDFITEASRLYAAALTHKPGADAAWTDVVRLYSLVARMRLLVSAPVVVATAESVMDSILQAYLSPNLTVADLQTLIHEGRVNFLRDFGEACRMDLEAVSRRAPRRLPRDNSALRDP